MQRTVGLNLPFFAPSLAGCRTTDAGERERERDRSSRILVQNAPSMWPEEPRRPLSVKPFLPQTKETEICQHPTMSHPPPAAPSPERVAPSPPRLVLLNVGHWRTGSTTLAEAARSAGLRAHREFPNTLTAKVHRQLLVDSLTAVRTWWHQQGGKDELVGLVREFDYVGDGWVPLLPFLGAAELAEWVERVRERERMEVRFVATIRPVPGLLRSELQHWVECDLEKVAGLDFEDRCHLESHLLHRATEHEAMMRSLDCGGVPVLRLGLDKISDWPALLHEATRTR
jgi:hypothetical protein